MAKDKSIFMATMVGLAAGLAVGILVAPRSGKETRAQLKRRGQKALDDVDTSIRQMGRDIKHQIDDLKDVAGELAEEAREESQDLIKRAEILKQDLATSASMLAKQTGETRDKAMSDAKRLMSEGAGVMSELERVTRHMLKLAKQKASD